MFSMGRLKMCDDCGCKDEHKDEEKEEDEE
jgi:hypothetical protein